MDKIMQMLRKILFSSPNNILLNKSINAINAINAMNATNAIDAITMAITLHPYIKHNIVQMLREDLFFDTLSSVYA